jgi:23S rRNA (adenine2503-C2)-methyltransferase
VKTSFYSLRYQDLLDLLLKAELNSSAATILYNWHYKKRRVDHDYSKVAKKTLDYIQENFDFWLPTIHSAIESSDKTVKFLFELRDKRRVESVLIPFMGKYSLCLSSQVGCAMKCSFCFTGTQPLERSLLTEEIVGQFIQAYLWLKANRGNDERILNLVFMGQGEPLHNFDAVKKSCEILLSQHGASLAAQRITVSTSGYLPGIVRWKEEMPQVNLALSLHSPFTEKRNQLIPVNIKYPLSQVMEGIDQVKLAKKQFVTYEYLLTEDFNDGEDDAHETARLLKDRRALINIIPFNPYPGAMYKRPSHERIERFKTILESYKIPTMVRVTKGDQELAACGQLNSKQI